MANFSIRKLDDTVYKRIRMQAAMHDNSMEEEIRQILTKAVGTSGNITDVFSQYFGTKNGVDLAQPNKNKPHNPMDFGE